MDIIRPELKRQKQVRRYVYVGVGLAAAVWLMAGLARLKPAAPNVERASVWTDTVKRGPMLREVRGIGTLVPETIWVLPAATDGHVDRRYVLPGTPVKTDTLIMDPSNPELEQQALDAEYQLKGAQAALEQTKAELENTLADKRAQAAAVSSQFRTAQVQQEVDEQAVAQGVGKEVDARKSRIAAEELAKQNDLAKKEVETFANLMAAQVAVQQATVDEKKEFYKLYKMQMQELHVRAGIDGVLQELDVDVGQRVTQGTVIAKVANQTQLKAVLQIAETQAKDIQIGQKASIDTHNGVIPGHVIRIDPAVLNGAAPWT